MKLIRVAAACINQTPLDWTGNEARIREAIREARAQKAAILCLPELCITGYGCEDAFYSVGTQHAALDILHKILPETRGMVVSLGLPLYFQNALFNTVCLIVDGKIIGFVAKQNLAGDGIHYEPRWFKAWPADIQKMVELASGTYPLGDLIFDCGGVRIGFEICEDAWVAYRPGIHLALHGVDLILNPSASHFAFNKIRIRERFVLEGSRAFGASYVYSNLLGNEAGRVIYDGGTLIASGGTLLAEGPRFSYKDVVVTSCQIDIEATRVTQLRTASFRPLIADKSLQLIHSKFIWPEETRWELSQVTSATWEKSTHLKEEEFTRSVALGLFDYLRKSRSQGFVVSLSGGADSAAVSCLVSFALRFAAAELGLDGVKSRLSFMRSLASLGSVEAMTQALLTTVYQASANSGSVTFNAAETVAKTLGAAFFSFPIGELVSGYMKIVEQAIQRPLDWKTDDLALQNIQARVRSPGVWMVANLKNALLLSTSNRSEAAVGYATMDGDTSGGLSPIAGIDKAFLRHWLRWLETDGPCDLGALPALKVINAQAPTAELRPAENKQTDEDDLMPYPVLEAIERAAIRDKQTPAEAYLRLEQEFPSTTPNQRVGWIERFFQLWCRNQWKRERYAPSFHLDDKNLDPKSWCRFPILSGGYQTELAELRSRVASRPYPCSFADYDLMEENSHHLQCRLYPESYVGDRRRGLS